MITQRMDAVLPIVKQDIERARILLKTLQQNFTGLGTLWVVTPADQADQVQAELSPSAHGIAMQVIAESTLIPELGQSSLLRGWYRQQLVKLAIAEQMQTANYLTLDADVICVRPTTPEDLAPGGKGLCCVLQENSHPDWYEGSSSVLGLEPRRRGILHNVTPAVLNREAVLALQSHLDQRARTGQFRSDLLGLKQRAGFALNSLRSFQPVPWRWYLMLGAPWTEYALYFTYLEATGQLERFHQYTDECIYSVEHSVWRSGAANFDSWDPRPLFEGRGAPYFAIVQSITKLAPQRVWAKLAPFLGQGRDGS